MGWTIFMDMHSGGGLKEPPYEKILIESDSEKQGKQIFYNRFGHSPERVTCTCCGEDYAVYYYETLEQGTAFYRNAKYNKETGEEGPSEDHRWYVREMDPRKYSDYRGREHEWEDNLYREYYTVEEYCSAPKVLCLRKEDLTEDDLSPTNIPKQGYVWVD